jgi:hypothetical protein
MFNSRVAQLAAAMVAILLLIALVIACIPLQWVSAQLPAELSLINPQGNLWSAQADALVVGNQPVGQLHFRLLPESLLRLNPTLAVTLNTAGGDLSFELSDVSDQTIEVNHIQFNGEISQAWLVALPIPLKAHLNLNWDHLKISNGTITESVGAARMDQIDLGNIPLNLNTLTIDSTTSNDAIVLNVATVNASNPLEMSIRLLPDRHYEVSGLMNTPSMGTNNVLSLLSPYTTADGQGHVRIQLAGQY